MKVKQKIENILFNIYIKLFQPFTRLDKYKENKIIVFATGPSLDNFNCQKNNYLNHTVIGINYLWNLPFINKVKTDIACMSDPDMFYDAGYIKKVLHQTSFLIMPLQVFIRKVWLWRYHKKIICVNYNNTKVWDVKDFTINITERIHSADTVTLEFVIPIMSYLNSPCVDIYGFDLDYGKVENDTLWRLRWASNINKSVQYIPDRVMERLNFCGQYKPSKEKK